ncbi:MAG TPA: hypothetical protein VN605_15285, partial [Thermoanaerobaculia bacterium]|nr:hypothetical protein [Thermoanaerobaculia bacterium]
LDMDRKVCGIVVASPDLIFGDGTTPDCGFAFGNAQTHTDKGTVGFAIPIAQIIAAFSPALTIQIATAASSGIDNTVLAAANAQAIEGAMLNPYEVEERLEADFARSEMTRWVRQLYFRHRDEVNGLIQENWRVTARWHRSGSAALYQSMVRSFHDPERPLPTEIDGRPLLQIAADFALVLDQCGSDQLRRDLHVARPLVPDVGGMTYPQIIEHLAGDDRQPPSVH